MHLTILGAGPATQNPGGACSSYLVRQGETALVLDMGSGAFANLQRHVAPDAVDAVVISHLHADHTLDLIPYRYWLDFKPGGAARRPRLLLPPGGHEALLRISGMQDDSPTFFSGLFDVSEYDPAQPATIGALTVTFHAMQHAPHTYGLRIAGAGTLAYSADSGPSPVLAALARDADLFLCENANAEDSAYAMHLTPHQAGSYAREAGARRLVLTHRWHVFGLEAAARAAADVFPGPVSVAREGDTYAIVAGDSSP
jgi:ribonuclease BN (tRNA processing enzyme)